MDGFYNVQDHNDIRAQNSGLTEQRPTSTSILSSAFLAASPHPLSHAQQDAFSSYSPQCAITVGMLQNRSPVSGGGGGGVGVQETTTPPQKKKVSSVRLTDPICAAGSTFLHASYGRAFISYMKHNISCEKTTDTCKQADHQATGQVSGPSPSLHHTCASSSHVNLQPSKNSKPCQLHQRMQTHV